MMAPNGPLSSVSGAAITDWMPMDARCRSTLRSRGNRRSVT